MNEKPIFCRNCKYFEQFDTGYGNATVCHHPTWFIFEKPHPSGFPDREFHENRYEPFKYNADCDCELFEKRRKKWWQFWVKEWDI